MDIFIPIRVTGFGHSQDEYLSKKFLITSTALASTVPKLYKSMQILATRTAQEKPPRYPRMLLYSPLAFAHNLMALSAV